jgi:hypothetical protein
MMSQHVARKSRQGMHTKLWWELSENELLEELKSQSSEEFHVYRNNGSHAVNGRLKALETVSRNKLNSQQDDENLGAQWKDMAT